MATVYKFYSFIEKIHEGAINLGSDTIKVMLTNNAPSLSWDEKADVTGELSTAYGYTAGGATFTVTSSAQSSGLYTLIGSDITWTAAGGNLGNGSFRYAIFYDDTATGDPLLWYIDYNYSITIADTQVFTIDIDQTSGIYFAS
jgi:hypothetical protein